MSVPKRKTKKSNSIFKESVEKEHEWLESLGVEELSDILQSHAGELSLRFASELNGYYVVANEDNEGLQVIYSGLSGPEHKPVKLSKANLRRLQSKSELIRFVPYEESPFDSFVIKK
ncbi:MAG: hypothetical protein U5K70_03370 [Halodesulfurarchaeum sp.]|nr:hypothetical protein [Halodesulfurarchaeum sp.]